MSIRNDQYLNERNKTIVIKQLKLAEMSIVKTPPLPPLPQSSVVRVENKMQSFPDYLFRKRIFLQPDQNLKNVMLFKSYNFFQIIHAVSETNCYILKNNTSQFFFYIRMKCGYINEKSS